MNVESRFEGGTLLQATYGTLFGLTDSVSSSLPFRLSSLSNRLLC